MDQIQIKKDTIITINEMIQSGFILLMEIARDPNEEFDHQFCEDWKEINRYI